MTLKINNQENKPKKKNKLRFNEYYDTQNMFDNLYAKSTRNENFYKLYELITDKNNIKLAFRTIKSNKGSTTKGTNKNTIKDIKEWNEENIVSYVRKRLANFKPHSVRRILIPKQDGTMRPLGIPTIEDRIIQQAIRQVLEPICEAKFYDYSFGFRLNRSAKHAIARCYHLMQRADLHFVVDIDIKGFFDNVSHSKLLKQMYCLGIRDKRILSIVSKMLKCEIEGVGTQNKGTPQGGILSPLLSNIVLNELDWWIHSQFYGMKTRHEYSCQLSHCTALKKTNLKEMHIVRYADDFKIFCRDIESANKIKFAVTKWLKERLNLEINEEKSRVVNLRTSYSDFLGLKMKVHRNGIKKYNNSNKIKYTIKSKVSDKAVDNLVNKIKRQIYQIQHARNPHSEISKLNQMIFGYHNYYESASHVSKSFHTIDYKTMKFLRNRLEPMKTNSGIRNKVIQKYYGESKAIKYYCNYALIPIAYVKTKPPMQFKKKTCDYTEEGRELIHKNLNYLLKSKITEILHFSKDNDKYSIEYYDNRISLFSAQNGKCSITKEPLKTYHFHCHHKIPKEQGGDDSYKNLTIVKSEVHSLIHAKSEVYIKKLLNKLKLSDVEIAIVNKHRNLCKLEGITI